MWMRFPRITQLTVIGLVDICIFFLCVDATIF